MSQMTVTEIAKELISFDTSGPPARELPAARWIKGFLEDLGVDAELQLVEPERANVVGKIGQGRGPGLVLSGHMDVVPPGDPALWKVTTPFEPVVKEGRLYGRGACDMKGPDACILEAVKELVKEDYRRQLSVVFTAGEDTGGWYVTKVLDEGKITTLDAMYGVIPEPSTMRIIRAHKGSGSARVMIRGRAAHSSRPEIGVNAIMKAVGFLEELRELQRSLRRTRHPLLGPSTIECTIIQGGFKTNIIPDQCTLTLNARLIPEHQGDETVRGWLEAIINKMRETDDELEAEILSISANQPLDVPEDSEIVSILRKILRTKPMGAPYFTEAVDYTRKGIPTVICGPGDIDQAHTPDEYIALEQLELGVKTLKETIKRVCL